jgi:hypothetical protein
MRKITLCLAATLALGACVRTATNEATGKVDVDIESPTKRGEDWSATLRGMGGFAAVSGDAKAMVREGKTEVRVSLIGAQPGGTHPWMVHEGTCALPGAAVGDHSAYTPITIAADGRGTQTANLNARLDEAKDYIILVHVSPNDMTNIVACGDLDD